jgi:hypothetical protein
MLSTRSRSRLGQAQSAVSFKQGADPCLEDLSGGDRDIVADDKEPYVHSATAGNARS